MTTDLIEAIQILKNGGVGVFPTDTVYGVGCSILDEKAVERLYDLKQRTKDQAFPVLVDSIAMVQEYLQPIPEDVRKQLMEKYWPGGLTIILPCISEKVFPLVRGEKTTLGVRIPNHSLTKALIQGIGAPIIGTSANFHGEETPESEADLNPAFIKGVDFVLSGECSGGISSTIIDCSVKPWKIIREGAVKL